jgi:hypothetical protein
MKQILWFLLLLLAACKPAPRNPSGHWEGNIILPGAQLTIRVDLQGSAAEGWSGTIDIPAQGVRNFRLAGTSVQGDAVSFGMPGIPGEPKFSGKLGAQGKEISGQFTQMGQTHAFKLERKPMPPASAIAETPSQGVPGKGLAGFWQGSLTPMAGVELRLLLEITNAPDDTLGGVLVSMDQGNARVPMTELSLVTNQVVFETRIIGGSFDGELSEDGSNIQGEWQQLGRRSPLTFMRLKAPPRLSEN